MVLQVRKQFMKVPPASLNFIFQSYASGFDAHGGDHFGFLTLRTLESFSQGQLVPSARNHVVIPQRVTGSGATPVSLFHPSITSNMVRTVTVIHDAKNLRIGKI